MMAISEQRKGELLIFFQALIWGMFPVITVLAYAEVLPLTALGVSTLFSSVFFALVLTKRGKWREVLDSRAFWDVLLGTLFLGILFYVLFFLGLKHTSPGNAGIIASTEVLFSFVFFHLWRRDSIPTSHIFGAVLMMLGAVIVLYPSFTHLRTGDFLVLTAAFVAPFGNFFQQRARKIVSSEAILFFRSVVSGSVVLFFVYFTSGPSIFSGAKGAFWVLLLNGVLVLGLGKVLWVEGIHRISVTKANALSMISPLLTLIYAWVLLNQGPTIWQLSAFVPLFFGTILLSRKA